MTKTQEEIDDLNRPRSTEETESVINNIPSQEAPSPDGFTDKFQQTLKKEIRPILYNLLEDRGEGTHPKSVYENTITLTPEPEKDKKKGKKRKENYRPDSPINTDAKILIKILAYQIQ